MKRRHLLAALGLGLSLAAGPTGCSSPAGKPVGAAEPVSLSPIPAPDGLVGQGFLPTPDASWLKARAAIGAPGAFFPQSFGGIAASALGLPVTVSGEIDGAVPALVSIASGADGRLRFVVAAHVKVGERFIDQLTKGPDARFTSKVDPATHIALLTPAGEGGDAGARPGKHGTALGVLGNYLLMAANDADLLAYGPYTARTLPTLPAPKEDLAIDATDRALGKEMQDRVKKGWDSLKERAAAAKAPVMLGDSIEQMIAVCGDLAKARFTLVLDGQSIHARAAVTPKPGAGPAQKALKEIAVGDAKPLLALPGISQAALVVRTSPDHGVAASAADVAKILGPSITPGDSETILASAKALREASGPWWTLGVALSTTGPTAFARAPSPDQEKTAKAFADLVALTKLDSVKARLKEIGLDVSTGKTVVENLPGDVQRIHLAKATSEAEHKGGKDDAKDKKAKSARAAKAPGPGETPGLVDILYLVEKEDVILALGLDSKEALKTIAKPETTIGSDADVKAAIDALGADVAFALLLDPARIVAAKVGKPVPERAAPLVLSVGKTAGDLAIRLDLSNFALQEIVRNRAAF